MRESAFSNRHASYVQIGADGSAFKSAETEKNLAAESKTVKKIHIWDSHSDVK